MKADRTAFVLLLALFVVSFALANVTIVTNTPSAGSNQTSTILIFNITSDRLINVSGNTSTILQWTNQSGAVANITPTSVVNVSAGTGENYSFWSLANLLNGTHSFKVYVWDNSTNSNVSIASVSNIRVSTSAPAVGFNNASGFNTTSTTPQVSFNITHNVFAQDLFYKVFIDGVSQTGENNTNTTNNTIIQFNATTLSNSTHTLVVETRDPIGNAANSSLTFRATSAPPAVTFTTQNNSNSSSAFSVNFTITDSVFTQDLAYRIYLNGTNQFQSGSATTNNTAIIYNITGFVNGTNNVTVEARDVLNNAQNSTMLIVTGYTDPPNATITSPANNTNSSGTAAIGFTVIDNFFTQDLFYKLYLNGVNATQPNTANLTNGSSATVGISGLVNGTNNITVEVRNAANNARNSTALQMIGRSVPSVTINTNTSFGNISNSTMILNFTVVDSLPLVSGNISYTVYENSTVLTSGTTTNNTMTSLNITLGFNGNQVIIVQATNNAGLSTNSTSITIGRLDTQGPAVTVTASNSGPTSGDTVNISCTLTDLDPTASITNFNITEPPGNVINYAGAVGSASYNLTFTDTSATGDYVVKCRAVDNLNNVGTGQRTITVSAAAAAAATTSSTGGGGTNTVNTNPAEAKITNLITIMPINMVNIVNVSSSSIEFKEYDIEVTNTATNVELTIAKYASRPSSATQALTGNIYKYYEITTKNLPDTNIKSAKITFKVPKSWISQNSYDKNTVVLNRYSGGSWSKLTTALTAEDSSDYTYTASTPGFSVFAITADMIPAVAPLGQSNPSGASTTGTEGAGAAAGNGTAGNQTGTGSAAGGTPLVFILVPLVILVIVLAGYFYYRNSTGEGIANKLKKIRKND